MVPSVYLLDSIYPSRRSLGVSRGALPLPSTRICSPWNAHLQLSFAKKVLEGEPCRGLHWVSCALFYVPIYILNKPNDLL